MATFTPNIGSRRRKKPVESPAAEEEAPAQEATPTQEETPTPAKRKRRASKKNAKDSDEEDAAPKEPERLTLSHLIRNNVNTGRPMKAALEKEENKRRKANGEKVSEPASPAPARVVRSEPEEPVLQAPRVRIVDGKIVMDSESLVVNTAEPSDGPELVAAGPEQTTRITSASFMKRVPSEKWSAKETEEFYNALRRYGTDFTLLEKLFANRNRRQLKNKFKREEKENPHKIDDALNSNIPIDMEHYKEALSAANEKKKQIEEARADKEMAAGVSAANNEQEPDSETPSKTAAPRSDDAFLEDGITPKKDKGKAPAVPQPSASAPKPAAKVPDEEVEDIDPATTFGDNYDGYADQYDYDEY